MLTPYQTEKHKQTRKNNHYYFLISKKNSEKHFRHLKKNKIKA